MPEDQLPRGDRAGRGNPAELLRGAAAEAGIKLLVEPINAIDIPGFFPKGPEQAMRIIDAVGSEKLFLQYDFYHMQIMQRDLVRALSG